MDIMAELEKTGAVLLNRHFVYKSGKHGSGYINMDPLFPDVKLISEVGKALAEPFSSTHVDTIAAPATGGILLAAFTALRWRAPSRDAPAAIWADKDGGDFAFERAGFTKCVKDKQVLVVEDLLTTGGSVAKVIHEVEINGGEVVGVSAIVNRGGVTAEDLGVSRLETLASVSFEAINADMCPLCKQGLPIVEDIGHGAEYKHDHPDYGGGYVTLVN